MEKKLDQEIAEEKNKPKKTRGAMTVSATKKTAASSTPTEQSWTQVSEMPSESEDDARFVMAFNQKDQEERMGYMAQEK